MISNEYVAGFFDGEGCVGIYNIKGKRDAKRGRVRLVVRIANSDRAVLAAIQSRFGGTLGENPYHPRPGKDRKLIYAWSINEESARPFLEAIEPYLIIKKEHVRLGLDFLDFCIERSKNIETGTIPMPNGRIRPFRRYPEKYHTRGLEYAEQMRVLINYAGRMTG